MASRLRSVTVSPRLKSLRTGQQTTADSDARSSKRTSFPQQACSSNKQEEVSQNVVTRNMVRKDTAHKLPERGKESEQDVSKAKKKEIEKTPKSSKFSSSGGRGDTEVSSPVIRRSARARKSKSALELLGIKIKEEPNDDGYEENATGSNKRNSTNDLPIPSKVMAPKPIVGVKRRSELNSGPSKRTRTSTLLSGDQSHPAKSRGIQNMSDETNVQTVELSSVDKKGRKSGENTVAGVTISAISQDNSTVPKNEEVSKAVHADHVLEKKLVTADNCDDEVTYSLENEATWFVVNEEDIESECGHSPVPADQNCDDLSEMDSARVIPGAGKVKETDSQVVGTVMKPMSPVMPPDDTRTSLYIIRTPETGQIVTVSDVPPATKKIHPKMLQPKGSLYSDKAGSQTIAYQDTKIYAKHHRKTQEHAFEVVPDSGSTSNLELASDVDSDVDDTEGIPIKAETDTNAQYPNIEKDHQYQLMQDGMFIIKPEDPGHQHNIDVDQGLEREQEFQLEGVEIITSEQDQASLNNENIVVIQGGDITQECGDMVDQGVVINIEEGNTGSQMSDHQIIQDGGVVVVRKGDADDGTDAEPAQQRQEDGQMTYEALVKLASEVIQHVEGYEQGVFYQVDLGDGRTSTFMIKGPEDDGDTRSPSKAKSPKKSPHTRHKSQLRKNVSKSNKIGPITSKELENQEKELGKTAKGRKRPMKQLVLKKEFQDLVMALNPTDDIDSHVTYRPAPHRRGAREMICKYCDIVVTDRHHFRKHIRTHKNADYKPYTCPLCPYKAQIKAAVARHINIHSDAMPYVCELCGRGFNFKQKLQVHMKYHQDIRDYQCPHCSLAFHEYKTLKNHIRKLHGSGAVIPSGQEARNLNISKTKDLSLNKRTEDGKIQKQYELGGRSPSEDQDQLMVYEDSTSENENSQDLSGTGQMNREEDHSVNDEPTSSAKFESSSPIFNTKPDDDLYPNAPTEQANTEAVKVLPVEQNADLSGAHSIIKLIPPVKDFNLTRDAVTNRTLDDGIMSSLQTTSMDSGNQSMLGSVSNKSTICIIPSTVSGNAIEVSGQKKKTKIQKFVVTKRSRIGGIKKTQCITNRYMQGLTRFGASHKEIVASKPWKTQKTQVRRSHIRQKDDKPVTPPKNVEEVEVDVYNEPVGPPAILTKLLQLTAEEKQKEDSILPGPLPKIIKLEDHVDKKTEEPLVSLKQIDECLSEHAQYLEGLECPYQCKKCLARFSSRSHVVNHLESKHPEIKLWECPDCDYKCRMRSSLFVHRKTHDTVKKYICSTCQKAFILQSKLNEHMKCHAATRDYPCEKCGKSFRRAGDLRKHDGRIHRTDQPLHCNVCNKGFRDKSQIKRHMESHVERKTLLCQVCNKYYKTSSSLHQHLKSHLCRFYCELCSKSFGSYSGFMAHKVMHTESFEGFNCDLCGKVLHTKGSLNRHLTISHSTARPFPCSECKSAFKTKKDLRNHALVHSTEKEFECSECGFRSKRFESLQVHKRRHQDVKPFRCGVCGREYTQKRSLQQHLPYHMSELQVRCPHCRKRCISKSQLEQHISKNHADEEAITETEGKDQVFYMCEECNSVFLTQDNLAVHILVTHMNQPSNIKVKLKTEPSDADPLPQSGEVSEGDGDETSTDVKQVTTVVENVVKSDTVGVIASSTETDDDNEDEGHTVAQYIEVTDPRSKKKKLVAVMHPIDNKMGIKHLTDATISDSGNVEVEGEVIMNLNEALRDQAQDADMSYITSSENVSNLLQDAAMTVPSEDSVGFTMQHKHESMMGDDHHNSETVISFLDPNTHEEFAVSMPQQALENLYIPAMETEVISLPHNDLHDESERDSFVSIDSSSVGIINDSLSISSSGIVNSLDNEGISSVAETVEVDENYNV